MTQGVPGNCYVLSDKPGIVPGDVGAAAATEEEKEVELEVRKVFRFSSDRDKLIANNTYMWKINLTAPYICRVHIQNPCLICTHDIFYRKNIYYIEGQSAYTYSSHLVDTSAI